MILYILRHGVAEDEAPDGDDGARRLTPRGRGRMRAAAAGMRALGLRFDVILTSPLVRATETAAIVAETYAGEPAPQELPALSAGVAPAETVRALKRWARREHVMIVGHEPGLSGVAALLLAGSPTAMTIALKKGGLIAVECSQAAAGGGTLRWMLTPRQLRKIRR